MLGFNVRGAGEEAEAKTKGACTCQDAMCTATVGGKHNKLEYEVAQPPFAPPIDSPQSLSYVYYFAVYWRL